MLPHTQVIIGAPNGDLGRSARVLGVADSGWKGTTTAFKLGEGAIVALIAERIELGFEEGLIIHGHSAASPTISAKSD